MYYRVATQVDAAPTWQWKSTALSSLDTLFQFLRLFRTLPQDQLRVFSSLAEFARGEACCYNQYVSEQLKRFQSTSLTR